MQREALGSIQVGKDYRYQSGGTYHVLGIGKHVHTHQELCAYQGVTGRDQGKLFFCPLFDFVTKFTPVASEQVTSGKVAGVYTQGSGV